jgi:lipid-A-disaccharide synthase
MVITYKMPKLSWWMIKRKCYLPYVGLPNILLGRFVVPELLQDDATPENLTQALLNLVNDRAAIAHIENTFSALHQTLRQNTAQKAAAAILPYLPAC